MTSEVKPEDRRHKVFKNDPKYFKSLINKTVEILTVDGKTHIGKVYVVDPVSESIVTITNTQDSSNVNIYLGHAIKSIQICDHKQQTSALSITPSLIHQQDTEEFKQKRLNLKEWLKKNLVDVQEDGLTLKLGEDLYIEPPYDNEHCYCSNTIILQRVRDILNKMPSSNT